MVRQPGKHPAANAFNGWIPTEAKGQVRPGDAEHRVESGDSSSGGISAG